MPRPLYLEEKPKHEIHAATGQTLRCKTWEAEAALRMLENNVDPNLAKEFLDIDSNPEDKLFWEMYRDAHLNTLALEGPISTHTALDLLSIAAAFFGLDTPVDAANAGLYAYEGDVPNTVGSIFGLLFPIIPGIVGREAMQQVSEEVFQRLGKEVGEEVAERAARGVAEDQLVGPNSGAQAGGRAGLSTQNAGDINAHLYPPDYPDLMTAIQTGNIAEFMLQRYGQSSSISSTQLTDFVMGHGDLSTRSIVT